jgi:hypothetical protein
VADIDYEERVKDHHVNPLINLDFDLGLDSDPGLDPGLDLDFNT